MSTGKSDFPKGSFPVSPLSENASSLSISKPIKSIKNTEANIASASQKLPTINALYSSERCFTQKALGAPFSAIKLDAAATKKSLLFASSSQDQDFISSFMQGNCADHHGLGIRDILADPKQFFEQLQPNSRIAALLFPTPQGHFADLVLTAETRKSFYQNPSLRKIQRHSLSLALFSFGMRLKGTKIHFHKELNSSNFQWLNKQGQEQRSLLYQMALSLSLLGSEEIAFNLCQEVLVLLNGLGLAEEASKFAQLKTKLEQQPFLKATKKSRDLSSKKLTPPAFAVSYLFEPKFFVETSQRYLFSDGKEGSSALKAELEGLKHTKLSQERIFHFLNAKNAQNESLLCLALKNKDTELLICLLSLIREVKDQSLKLALLADFDQEGSTSLMLAAQCEDESMLALLLDLIKSLKPANQKALFDRKKHNGASAFLLAIQAGKIENTKMLVDFISSFSLEKQFELLLAKTTKENMNTFLMLAQTGNIKLFEFLLGRIALNFDFSTLPQLLFAANANGATPLLMAAQLGHKQIVTALLDYIDAHHNRETKFKFIAAKTKNNLSALHVAIHEGNKECALLLLNFIQQFNASEKFLLLGSKLAYQSQSTVLHKAIITKQSEILDALLKLIDSIESKEPEIYLFDEGCSNPYSAIEQAIMVNDVNILNKLLSFIKKYDLKTQLKLLEVKSEFKSSALMLAASQKDPACLELLLNHIAHCDKNTKLALLSGQFQTQKTPLHCAVESQNKKSLELLLKFIQQFDKYSHFELVSKGATEGNTALHFAVKKESNEITAQLLNAVFAKDKHYLLNLIDKKNSSEESALYCAVENQNIRNLDALLTAVEKVNMPDSMERLMAARTAQGNTPMHAAATKNNLALVKALLESIKDLPKNSQLKLIDLANENGVTPIQLAVEHGCKASASLLLKSIKKLAEQAKLKDTYDSLLKRAVKDQESKIFPSLLEKYMLRFGKKALQEQLFYVDAAGESLLSMAIQHEAIENIKLIIDTVRTLKNDLLFRLLSSISLHQLVQEKRQALLELVLANLPFFTQEQSLEWLNTTTAQGENPLLFAVKKRNFSALESILSAIATLSKEGQIQILNAKDLRGQSALSTAINYATSVKEHSYLEAFFQSTQSLSDINAKIKEVLNKLDQDQLLFAKIDKLQDRL